MSIDFHRLIEAIDNNRLIIDYIDCLSMIRFHQLGTLGYGNGPLLCQFCTGLVPDLTPVRAHSVATTATNKVRFNTGNINLYFNIFKLKSVYQTINYN